MSGSLLGTFSTDQDEGAARGSPVGAGSTEPTWPTAGIWARLVGFLVVLVVIGAGGVLALTWPRSAGVVVGVATHPEAHEAGNAPDRGDTAEAAAWATPGLSPEPIAQSPAAWLLVHVTGEVRRPGVVRLPVGSRVQDAVGAAGGVRRGGDVGRTNLARPLVDGERLDVGGTGSQPEGPRGEMSPEPAPVDLNTASAEALQTLPGVGPVTAERILAWRSANGRFTIVDELVEVPGIGPKTLAQLRPRVRV